jgi:hypothetical protein
MAEYDFKVCKSAEEFEKLLKGDGRWIEPTAKPVASHSYLDPMKKQFLGAFISLESLDKIKEVAILPIQDRAVTYVGEREECSPEYQTLGKTLPKKILAGIKRTRTMNKDTCSIYRLLIRI